MKRHNIHHHCFQVSTTERVSSSPSILLKALFPPFGSLWLSKTSRWHFFRYNLDHIHSNWENLYLLKLKTCPQGDRGVVELGQPGLPGLLAHVALHSDHVGRRIQPVHRHHHLSRWVLAKVGHHYHHLCHHHHHHLNHQQVHHLVCLPSPLWSQKFFIPRTIKLRLESGTMSKEVFSAKFSWHWNWTCLVVRITQLPDSRNNYINIPKCWVRALGSKNRLK